MQRLCSEDFLGWAHNKDNGKVRRTFFKFFRLEVESHTNPYILNIILSTIASASLIVVCFCFAIFFSVLIFLFDFLINLCWIFLLRYLIFLDFDA